MVRDWLTNDKCTHFLSTSRVDLIDFVLYNGSSAYKHNNTWKQNNFNL